MSEESGRTEARGFRYNKTILADQSFISGHRNMEVDSNDDDSYKNAYNSDFVN